MKVSKKVAAAIATGAVAVAGSGVAYAYIVSSASVSSSGGTGTVTATSGTPNNVSWNEAASTATAMVPGGAAKTVTVTFTNPNSYSVDIGAHTFSVSGVSGPTNCNSNTVADLSTTSATPSSFVVPGTSQPSNTKTFDVSISMGDLVGTDQTPCTTGPLTVTLTLT